MATNPKKNTLLTGGLEPDIAGDAMGQFFMNQNQQANNPFLPGAQLAGPRATPELLEKPSGMAGLDEMRRLLRRGGRRSTVKAASGTGTALTRPQVTAVGY